MTDHILYLHGFASSPGSTKARLLRERLTPYDAKLHVPDLNVPDFEHLTLTAMIARTAETVAALPDDAPVHLIGSSLGGLTAVHFLDQHRGSIAQRVHSALLLAPALDFLDNREKQLGIDGLRQWRERGWLPVTHYAQPGEFRLHYGLVEDIQRYDSFSVDIPQPLLIVHGKQDESVDYRQSVRFATNRPGVTLRLPDADHALLNAMDAVWSDLCTHFKLKMR